MAVVVDYENMYRTGQELFAPDESRENCIIDPFRLGCQIAKARNHQNYNKPDYQVELSRVEVYRGCPAQSKNPEGYNRAQSQRSTWMRGHNGVLDVTLRPLKYYEGRPPQEKGVDVLCALAMVRLCRNQQFDVVVLASHDTDLAPALDEAQKMTSTRAEAAKWYDPDIRQTKGYLPTERKIWTTSLWEFAWKDALDPYRDSYV